MGFFTLIYRQVQNNRFGAPVEKTLADWGITSCTREAQNQAQDNLGFNITTAANGPELFTYGSQITLMIGRQGVATGTATQPTQFSGGTQWFQGYQMHNVRSATGRMQSFKYKFSGPWGYLLERHVFQKLWPTWNGSKLVLNPRSEVVLGQSVTTITEANGAQTTQMTLAQQVEEIANYCINQTIVEFGQALFQLDSNFTYGNFDGVGGWQGFCPFDAANDITCAEAIRRTVKIVPSVSMWFDYSTNPPTLHIATRDTLPSVTLPWGNSLPQSPYGNYTSEIDRRDDVIPPCVDYKYRISTTINGFTYESIVDDIGCAAGATTPAGVTPANLLPFAEYFGAEVATFDFNGGAITTTILDTMPIPFDTNADFASASPIWTTVLVSSLSDHTVTNVGPPNAVTGFPPAVLTYPNGSQSLSPYKYFMIGGPVPKGIIDPLNPNLPQGVQLTLAQTFKYTTQTLSLDGSNYIPGETKSERKTVSIYCFSLPSGTYTNSTLGEAIPFGLANFVYQLEAVPQYDGKHGIVEADTQTGFPTITDPCPIGVNLNLSGNQAQYLTMNAQVQTVSYDLMTGHTEINFGVANHLGGAQFIERLRLNRGPRWYYEIATGVDGSGAISGPTQLKDTQDAVSTSNSCWMPIGTTSDGSGTAPNYPNGFPGITHDTVNAGGVNWGGPGTVAAPLTPPPGTACTTLMAEGTGGALTRWIRICTSDLPAGAQAYFQPSGPGSSTYVLSTGPVGGGGGGGGITQTTVLQVNVDGNTLTCGGNVAGVTITYGGSGYVTAPLVAFSVSPNGTTATGVAIVTGGQVTGVTVTNGGSGYLISPTVTFNGGGGTGATATASLSNFLVAMPFQLQKTTYDGQTITLPDGTHSYSFVSASVRKDTTLDPVSGQVVAYASIWPPYVATAGNSPIGWAQISVFAPPAGTGIRGVTYQEIGTERRWVNQNVVCYAGTTAYIFTESNATATKIT